MMVIFILLTKMDAIKRFVSILMLAPLFLVSVVFAKELSGIKSKTIEPNRTADGKYNFSSKSDEERLLFDSFNAPIEFIYSPSLEGVSGLRIYKDSMERNYLLEVKRVTNWKEVNNQLNTEFPSGNEVRTITLAQWEEQKKQMQALKERRREEWLRRQTIRTQEVTISDTFADRIKTTITNAIKQAKKEEKKIPKSGNISQIVEVIKDGDEAIFRCIVGDQLWTLKYHVPEGEFQTLSDLFRQMIADVEAGSFDEAKYSGQLEN